MPGGRPSKLDATQQAIARARARQGEPYAKIAASYGVSESTIARAIGVRSRLGARPRPRVVCFGCGSTEVRRFHLSIHVPGSRTTRGAGPIHLCEPCWVRARAGGRPSGSS